MQQIIAKCRSYFDTKCDQSLLHIVSGCLSQNVSVLLQNGAITEYNDTWSK